MLANPRLCGDLGCVPGGSEGRSVGQVEVADAVDGHRVEQCGGVDVDAFGDFGAAVSDELSAEERPWCRSPVTRMWMDVAPG